MVQFRHKAAPNFTTSKILNMEKITICYEFTFCMVVQKKNGKTYKKHKMTAVGATCSNALWDALFVCKRRKTIILSVNEVTARRIIFAYDQSGQFLQLKLSDFPPVIPTDFEKSVAILPQKRPL